MLETYLPNSILSSYRHREKGEEAHLGAHRECQLENHAGGILCCTY